MFAKHVLSLFLMPLFARVSILGAYAKKDTDLKMSHLPQFLTILTNNITHSHDELLTHSPLFTQENAISIWVVFLKQDRTFILRFQIAVSK